MHKIDVSLFVMCLQQRIHAFKYDQLEDTIPIIDSYNGGYAKACDDAIDYLSRVSREWERE